MRRKALVLLPLIGALACSSEDSRKGDGGPDHDGPKTETDGLTTGKTLSWLAPAVVDENRAGKHAAIASCGAVVGVAYFRSLKDPVTVTCRASFGGADTPTDRPAQDLYYVQFDGSSWGAPVKVDQTIGPTFGLSIAMDSACAVHIGYLGGEISRMACGSSDAMIASSTNGGQSWTPRMVSSAGLTGDTVGHWMSVAVDSTGEVHAAYREVGYGFYQSDDQTKASLWYDTTQISERNGSGTYAALCFGPSDKPVVAHYNGTKTGAEGGVLVLSGASWTQSQVAQGATSERIDLATDGKGTYGLAHYSDAKQTLMYEESKDLGAWATKEVDTRLTRKGTFSSLAFDSAGNPAISYYLCNEYGETSCDASKDGLLFAHRRGGKWELVSQPIDEGGAQYCGEYTALTFTPGDQPVIAYQCSVYNNQLGDWVDNLKVVRGEWK